MPFYPTNTPGAQFSGNTLRPTGPMPMQAQQGAQLNSPTPTMGPAAGGPAPTIPGVPTGGFQNPAYRAPVAAAPQILGQPIAQVNPVHAALAAIVNPATPQGVASNLRMLLGIR